MEIGCQREHQQREADEDGCESNHFGEIEQPEWGSSSDPAVELALRDGALILERPLMLELLFALDARENHHVHGKTIGAQVRVDEVNGEDEENRQQTFFAVNDEHGVQRPSRQEVREEWGKPHGVTGKADDDHAPKHRPAIELLPIGVALKLRLGTEAEEPAHVSEEILDIFPVGHHGGRTPEDSLFATQEAALEYFFDMDKKSDGENQGTEFMKEKNCTEAADTGRKLASPEAFAEAHGQAGGREAEKG